MDRVEVFFEENWEKLVIQRKTSNPSFLGVKAQLVLPTFSFQAFPVHNFSSARNVYSHDSMILE